MKKTYQFTTNQAIGKAGILIQQHHLANVRVMTSPAGILAYMVVRPGQVIHPHQTFEVHYWGKLIATVEIKEESPETTRINIEPKIDAILGIEQSTVERVLEAFIQKISQASVDGAPMKPGKDDSIETWFDYYHKRNKHSRRYTLKEMAKELNLSHQYVKTLHAKYLAGHSDSVR